MSGLEGSGHTGSLSRSRYQDQPVCITTNREGPASRSPLGEDGGVFIPAKKQSGAQIGMGTPLKPAEREE